MFVRLFTIFINDLLGSFEVTILVLSYIDDVELVCSGRNNDEMVAR